MSHAVVTVQMASHAKCIGKLCQVNLVGDILLLLVCAMTVDTREAQTQIVWMFTQVLCGLYDIMFLLLLFM